MRTGRNTRAWLFLALLAWAQIGLRQTGTGQAAVAIAPLPRLSRVVLLPLPEPIHDARVLEALAEMRGGKRNRPPAPKPPHRNNRFDKLQKGDPKKKDKTKTKPPPAVPLLTASQWQTIARVLFRETLAERLQTALKITLVPDEDTRDALRGLPTGAALTPETAGQLALKCKADAVLTVADETLTLPADETKRTTLRVRLRVFGPRSLPEAGAKAVLPQRDFFYGKRGGKARDSIWETDFAPGRAGNGTGGAAGGPSRRAYPANRRNSAAVPARCKICAGPGSLIRFGGRTAFCGGRAQSAARGGSRPGL